MLTVVILGVFVLSVVAPKFQNTCILLIDSPGTSWPIKKQSSSPVTSAVVEHSPHYPEVEGSSPASGSGRKREHGNKIILFIFNDEELGIKKWR
jgi:hypothetical protein